MKNIFLLLLFCPIILNFSIKLTKEQKELFSTASEIGKQLAAIKLSYFSFMEFLKEKESSGCYLGASIIPECPKDTVEFLNYASNSIRSCFQKCEENEIRRGNTCFKCENGEKISIKEESVFGIKQENIVCGGKKKAKGYPPKEIKNNHCMKNTTFYKTGECILDCNAIGLKPFGNNEYCAIDESDYHHMLDNKITPYIHYFYKIIVSKIIGFIFDKIRKGKGGKEGKVDDNYKMGIIESIQKAIFFINEKVNGKYIEDMIKSYKVNMYLAKAHLTYAGKESFLACFENFVNNELDADGHIIGIARKFADKMYDKMVNKIDENKIEKIKDKEGFINVLYKSFTGILKFFDIFEFSDLIINCYKSKEEGFANCFDSILNTIEDIDDFYDPLCLVAYVRASSASNPPICDIRVHAENSEHIFYWNLDQYPKIYKNDWYD